MAHCTDPPLELTSECATGHCYKMQRFSSHQQMSAPIMKKYRYFLYLTIAQRLAFLQTSIVWYRKFPSHEASQSSACYSIVAEMQSDRKEK